MADGIEAWYVRVDRDSSDKLGLAGMLFRTCSNILFHLIRGPAKSDLSANAYDALRTEAHRFSLWGDGFDTKDGGLDEILAHSSNLRQTVIYFLDACGTSLSGLANEYPTVSRLSDLCNEIKPLQAQAECITAKLQNNIINFKGEAKQTDVDDINLIGSLIENLEVSDCGSSTASNRFEETLDDLRGYIDCLLDLAPAIGNPAEDFTLEDQPGNPSEVNVVPADQRLFFAEIVSQWPSIDKGLAGRLAEANRKREQGLKAKLRQHQVLEDGMEESLAQDDLVISSPISRTQTIDSGVVLSHATSLPSDTSVGTSFNDTDSYTIRRRVPKLPEGHEWGTDFQCIVCGDSLKNIESPASWKSHVFRDLRPYICTYLECAEGIAFVSEREWIEHEFKKHRIEKYWSCLYCPKESFDSFALCQEHIIKVHNGAEYKALTLQQRWDIAEATSLARIRSQSPEKQECPFCLTVVANTIPKFGAHVGQHLREISIAAIPWSVFGDSGYRSETYQDEEAEEDEISEAKDELLNDDFPESETLLPWNLDKKKVPPLQTIRAAYNYHFRYQTCIGMTQKGTRCRFKIAPSGVSEFLKDSKKLQSRLYTKSVGLNDLEQLASNALCRRWHQSQAPEIASAWLKQVKRTALSNQNLPDEIDEDSIRYIFGGSLRHDFTFELPGLFQLDPSELSINVRKNTHFKK